MCDVGLHYIILIAIRLHQNVSYMRKVEKFHERDDPFLPLLRLRRH